MLTTRSARASSNDSSNRHHVYIAVMGVTGAGKSTFIRTATEIETIEIGHDLKSCKSTAKIPLFRLIEKGTADVQPYTFSHEDYDITLIDTPGFNDTLRSETEVLREIADWLDLTYRNPPKIKLTGIIYMQAATDKRMFGSTLRNLKMFRQLCGDEPLRNVVLVTTCWGTAERSGDIEKAVANEEQLRTDPLFWQPMLKRGSTMVRFEDTKESALSVIREVIDKNPIVLQIQRELVDEDKDLIDTTAGATVNEEIQKLEARYKKDLAEVQAEMQDALNSKDQEMQDVLAESKANLERLREDNRRAHDVLQYDRRNADRRRDRELQSLRMELENTRITSRNDVAAMKLEMRIHAEAQRFEDQLHFEGIVAQIRQNYNRVRSEDRVAIEMRIRELEGQRNRTGRGKELLLRLIPLVGRVALAALGFHLLGNGPFSGMMDEMNGDSSAAGGSHGFDGRYGRQYEAGRGHSGEQTDTQPPPPYTTYEVEEVE